MSPLLPPNNKNRKRRPTSLRKKVQSNTVKNLRIRSLKTNQTARYLSQFIVTQSRNRQFRTRSLSPENERTPTLQSLVRKRKIDRWIMEHFLYKTQSRKLLRHRRSRNRRTLRINLILQTQHRSFSKHASRILVFPLRPKVQHKKIIRSSQCSLSLKNRSRLILEDSKTTQKHRMLSSLRKISHSDV